MGKDTSATPASMLKLWAPCRTFPDLAKFWQAERYRYFQWPWTPTIGTPNKGGVTRGSLVGHVEPEMRLFDSINQYRVDLFYHRFSGRNSRSGQSKRLDVGFGRPGMLPVSTSPLFFFRTHCHTDFFVSSSVPIHDMIVQSFQFGQKGTLGRDFDESCTTQTVHIAIQPHDSHVGMGITSDGIERLNLLSIIHHRGSRGLTPDAIPQGDCQILGQHVDDMSDMSQSSRHFVVGDDHHGGGGGTATHVGRHEFQTSNAIALIVDSNGINDCQFFDESYLLCIPQEM